MAAWEKGAPTSVMMAAARENSGVQPTLVVTVTRTSPAWSWNPSSGLFSRRTTPSTMPAAPAKPVTELEAGAAVGSWAL